MTPARRVNHSHSFCHRCHCHQLLSSMAAATTPSPPPPSTATAVNNAAIGAVGSIPLPPPSTTTAVNKGGGSTLASAVTIAAACADVTAPLTLLSMVGCCVVCHPLPAASSAVQICEPLPSRDHRRFCHWAATPFCLPSHHQPLSCCSFTEHRLLFLLPLMVGCCILRPLSSMPTTSTS